MTPQSHALPAFEQTLEGVYFKVLKGPGRLELAKQILFPRSEHWVTFEVLVPSGGRIHVRVEHPALSTDWTPDLNIQSTIGQIEIEQETVDNKASVNSRAYCSLLRISKYNPEQREGDLQFFLQHGYAAKRQWDILRFPMRSGVSGNQVQCLVFDRREERAYPCSLVILDQLEGAACVRSFQADVVSMGNYGGQVRGRPFKVAGSIDMYDNGTLQELE